MAIASEIINLNTNLTNSYTACQNKGATIPTDQNFDNLATCIGSITTGGSAVISSLNITPTTSAQTITAPSGTDGYSPVNVAAVTAAIDQNISASNIKKDVVILGVTGSYEGSGGGGIGINREVKNGVYQMPTENFTFSLPSDATSVAEQALYYAFYNCTGLTSVDLSSLTTLPNYGGLFGAFFFCRNLTSVDLSSLTIMSGGSNLRTAFRGCTNLVNVDLSSLTTLSGSYELNQAFYQCTSLASISFPALTTISGSEGMSSAFQGCTALTSISFPALTTMTGSYAMSSVFASCTALTSISFPALTTTSFGSYKNQFSSMMSSTGSTTTHTIHFPSNLQSKISTLTGYPLFGGTSGKVVLAFDLPATS